MHRNIHILAITSALVLGIIAAPEQANAGSYDSVEVDVAQNMLTFVSDDAPLQENGFPAYGNTFIIQGYLYPEGTLDGASGVNPDGSPEFPELVIGTWICRGWFLQDFSTEMAGPFVATTQIYQFGETAADDQLTTEGVELADPGVTFKRSLTGGTGRYRNATGQQKQTLIGVNAVGGFNLRVKFRIRD